MWPSIPRALPMYHLPYLRQHAGEAIYPITPHNFYNSTQPVGAINVRGLPRANFTPPLPPPTPRLPSILPRRHVKPPGHHNSVVSELEWDDFEICVDDSQSNSPDGSDDDNSDTRSVSSDSDLEWDDFDLRNSGDESAEVEASLAMDNLYPLLNSVTTRPLQRCGVPLGAIQVNKLPRISCTFAGLAHVPEEFCYAIRSRNINKDLLTLTSQLNGYDSDIWDYEDEYQTKKLGKTFSNESLNSDISTVSTQESGYRSSGTAKSRDTPDLPTDTSIAESYGDGTVVEYYDHFADYNYIYKLSPGYLDSPLSASLTDLSDATLCEFNENANLEHKQRSASMETLRSESNTDPPTKIPRNESEPQRSDSMETLRSDSNNDPPTKIPRTEPNCVVCEKRAWCDLSPQSSSLHELADDNCTVHLDPDTLSACYHSNHKQESNYDIPADDLLTSGESPPPLYYYGNHDIAELLDLEDPYSSAQYQLSPRLVGNQKGRRAVKKRKRKAYDKLDDDVIEQTTGDDKKSKRLAPNYFVAIQVSDAEIHTNLRNIQLSVMQSDEKLKDAMIPIPTLHLTVMVMHIANEEELERAKDALKTCHILLAPAFEEEVLTIPFAGLGHFNNQVMFARIQDGEHVNALYEIAETVEKVYNQYDIVSTGERGFKPHLTVMKLSRAPSLRRKGVRRIKSEYYRNFSAEYFGSQIVKGLQLCSINKPKLEDGYYWRAAEIHFDAAERLETVAMTRMMLNDIIKEAIDQVETDENEEVVMVTEETEVENKPSGDQEKTGTEVTTDDSN